MPLLPDVTIPASLNNLNLLYDQIKLFDCGSLCNQEKKPYVQSIKVSKPLLKDANNNSLINNISCILG